MTTTAKALACYCCQSEDLQTVFRYREPPAGETRFSFSDSSEYRRDFVRCGDCGHMTSVHSMDLTALYEGEYVESTYQGDRLAKTFERIIGLPSDRSDNVGRCTYVDRTVREYRRREVLPDESLRILDIGSGLCVFLHRMKSLGWRGVALDPDPRAAAHARETVGVEAIEGDFFAVEIDKRFDVVSLNKVIEHVECPVRMLERAARCVTSDGLVYIEVPDGEVASRHGPAREEFYIEHLHAFSLTSTVAICQRAGLDVITIERLQEPSTKFTIRAFAKPRVTS